jgi:hypothetical protein
MAEDIINNGKGEMPTNDQETNAMKMVNDIMERRRTTPPTRGELEADSYQPTRAMLAQLIQYVAESTVKVVNAKGKGALMREISARLRASLTIDAAVAGDQLAQWTKDSLFNELIAKLTDYLQVVGTSSPSEAEGPGGTEA